MPRKAHLLYMLLLGLVYCDPVYIETDSPAKESDVYSFGVVLFELLCGRLNTPNKYEHRSLAELTRLCYQKNELSGIIFGNIKDEISPSSLRAFVTISFRCLGRDREERPTMKDILKTLETALERVHPDRASSCKIMLQDIKLPVADIISKLHEWSLWFGVG
uniref:Protein kinase domain-containing protein n=1 Tax=Lactuca sativa TaxID=4236 RepID=A0A9R1VH15_LACSA|nr:hypothetical protein LSAT_V11C500248350 [Lactuca sativa]